MISRLSLKKPQKRSRQGGLILKKMSTVIVKKLWSKRRGDDGHAMSFGYENKKKLPVPQDPIESPALQVQIWDLHWSRADFENEKDK